jgi:hypothetical protein
MFYTGVGDSLYVGSVRDPSANERPDPDPAYEYVMYPEHASETVPVFLNVYRAPESIPRNEFRQPM